MNWTKIAVLFFFLTVIITTGIFGAYFGYTVSGMPKGLEIGERETIVVSWEYWDLLGKHVEELEVYADTYEATNGNTLEVVTDTPPKKPSLMGQGISYFWYLVSFQIDDMPIFISAIFVLMSLVTLYLIVTAFLPGGSS